MFLNPTLNGAKSRRERQVPSFSALLADTRTQVGLCWEAASAIAQINAPLGDHPARLQFMASLSRLLETLGYFDAGVDPSSTGLQSRKQPSSVRQQYAAVRAHGHAALLAGASLLDAAAKGSHPAGEDHAAILGEALARLRAHIDELGDVLIGNCAQVA